jgi:hypothetical protein
MEQKPVVLWGMHKVLFKAEIPVWVPIVTLGFLTTAKIDTILEKVFEKLRPITAEQIRTVVPEFSADGIAEDGEEPLIVRAWNLGRLTNDQAKNNCVQI